MEKGDLSLMDAMVWRVQNIDLTTGTALSLAISSVAREQPHPIIAEMLEVILRESFKAVLLLHYCDQEQKV